MNEQEKDLVRAGRRVTVVGAVANIVLTGLKFLLGYFGHSQALIADAVHSGSDLFTDVVTLIGLHVGRREPDDDHPFGHGRLETLAATIVGLALIGAGLHIMISSGVNAYQHDLTRPKIWAVWGAVLSVVVKEALFQYTALVGRRLKSPVIQANAWHHRSDAFSSIAVLIGVTGAWFRPQWQVLDAYAALIVSFFILHVGVKIIWASVREFTDTAPERQVVQEIEACARQVGGVKDVHDLKVRTTAGFYQIQIHVVVDGNLTVIEGHRIAKKVEHCLLQDLDLAAGVIVHVDPDEEEVQ